MATKTVSSLAVSFILFLVIFEMPEIEAQESECLKEYGGPVGFGFCGPRIFPTYCYRRCVADKGAKGGKCEWNEETVDATCLCDFCSSKPEVSDSK